MADCCTAEQVYAGDKVDFRIKQWTTYQRVFTYQDCSGNLIDLTGYTAQLQMRATPDAPDPPLYDSSTNADITLGGAAGTVTLKIPATTTGAWTFQSAVYDLNLTDGNGVVTQLVRGRVRVDLNVTHS